MLRIWCSFWSVRPVLFLNILDGGQRFDTGLDELQRVGASPTGLLGPSCRYTSSSWLSSSVSSSGGPRLVALAMVFKEVSMMEGRSALRFQSSKSSLIYSRLFDRLQLAGCNCRSDRQFNNSSIVQSSSINGSTVNDLHLENALPEPKRDCQQRASGHTVIAVLRDYGNSLWTTLRGSGGHYMSLESRLSLTYHILN